MINTSSLTNVASTIIDARNFIHHIGLKFNWKPKLGGREFLLLSLVRSSNNADSILSKKTSEGFVTARFLYQYEKQNTPKKKASMKMRVSRWFCSTHWPRYCCPSCCPARTGISFGLIQNRRGVRSCHCRRLYVGVQARGRKWLQPPQFQKFWGFLGRNADDSGKSTWEKTFSKVVKARLVDYFLWRLPCKNGIDPSSKWRPKIQIG